MIKRVRIWGNKESFIYFLLLFYYNMNSSIPTKENTMTPLEESLQLQIKNYRNQINVLQKKIEYYENEHFKKSSMLSSQIKYIGMNEGKLRNEIRQRDIMIEQYENQIKEMQMEIVRMENTINYYKRKERDLCYKETIECTPISTSYNEYDIPNEDKIKELVILLKQYSEEISKLKNENNEMSISIEKYKQCNEEINNEIKLIAQWIDNYIDNKELNDVPSLYHDNEIKCVNFDVLKLSVNKARQRISQIMKEQNEKNEEMKSLLKEYQMNNASLKEELCIANENEYKIHDLLSNNETQLKLQSEKINSLDITIDNIKRNHCVYIDTIYKSLHLQITSILNENFFKQFHPIFLSNQSQSSIEDLVSISLNQLLQFTNELMSSFISLKNENITNYYSSKDQLEQKEEIIQQLSKENELLHKENEILHKINSTISKETSRTYTII